MQQNHSSLRLPSKCLSKDFALRFPIFQLNTTPRSDPQKYAEVICDTVVVLSNLLRSSSKGVRAITASALLSMLEQDEGQSPTNRPESEDVPASALSRSTSTSDHYSLHIIFQRSGCISIIVSALKNFAWKLTSTAGKDACGQSIRMSSEQEAEVLPLLKLVNELARDAENARSLIEEGVPCVVSISEN